MPRTSLPKLLFKPNGGFYFGNHEIFAMGDANTTITAILGDVNIDRNNPETLGATKVQIHSTVCMLFQIFLENAELFVALRGPNLPVFFQTIAPEFEAHVEGELPLRLMVHLKDIYVTARRSFRTSGPNVTKTDLTTIVDKWIVIEDKVAELPAPAGFTVSESPALLDALASSFPGVTLPTAVWPPAHFPPREAALIGNPRIRHAVYGVRHLYQPEGRVAPGLPVRSSTPLQVNAYLAYTALYFSTVNSPWKLFVSTIGGFKNAAERRRSHVTTRPITVQYALIDVYLGYAVEALRSGRSYVVGLITPWFGQIPAVTATPAPRSANDIQAREAEEAGWASRCYKQGMALVLRREGGTGTPAGYMDVEVVLYNPTATSRVLRNNPAFSSRANYVSTFYDMLKDKIAEATARGGMRVIRGWTGGPDTIQGAPGDDSVALAAKFVRDLVSSDEENGDPFAISEEEMKSWGFERM